MGNRASLMALLRASNRDAPEGYEENPAWTAAQTTVPMLEQRSRDRIDVANRASQAHMFESGDWAPDREYAPAGLEGLMEGLFHNDNAANIDPAGNVQGDPKQVKVRWNTFGQQFRRRKELVSGVPHPDRPQTQMDWL